MTTVMGPWPTLGIPFGVVVEGSRISKPLSDGTQHFHRGSLKMVPQQREPTDFEMDQASERDGYWASGVG